ncbi:hypothetical protein OH807_11560 [Kitasatospora sp. NBC_01560]
MAALTLLPVALLLALTAWACPARPAAPQEPAPATVTATATVPAP